MKTITSIIISLASLGTNPSMKPIIFSREIEKYDVINTTIVTIGIRAKTKKKAIFPGNILISGLLNVLNAFSI